MAEVRILTFPEPWRNLGRGGTGSDSGLHGLPLAAVGGPPCEVKVEGREAREERLLVTV